METTGKKKMNEGKNRKVVNRWTDENRQIRTDKHKDLHQTHTHHNDSHQTHTQHNDSRQTHTHHNDSRQIHTQHNDSHQTHTHHNDSPQTHTHHNDSHQTHTHHNDSHQTHTHHNSVHLTTCYSFNKPPKWMIILELFRTWRYAADSNNFIVTSRPANYLQVTPNRMKQQRTHSTQHHSTTPQSQVKCCTVTCSLMLTWMTGMWHVWGRGGGRGFVGEAPRNDA